MEYYAHIKGYEKQRLLEHLTSVSIMARNFASKIGLGEQGELIGLLHDIGKYSKTFQTYLKSATGMINPDEDEYVDAHGLKGKIDHSTCGAQYLFKKLSGDSESNVIAQILSLCIASHHSGIINCLSLDGTDEYIKRMSKNDSKTNYNEVLAKMDESILRRSEEIISSLTLKKALIETLKKVHSPYEKSRVTTYFKQGLLIRFLFSCLIDADRLDSADFESPHFSHFRNNGKYRSWNELIARLEKRLSGFIRRNEVDDLRKDISDNCLNYAENPRGIYTLTVPTGGGKTLSSLRFALYHAKFHSSGLHKIDRIIFVIPYTSIIDQNADEVRKFIEDRADDGSYLQSVILEHHSNLTPEEETWQQKLLSQDWDAPIVFTTSVQILESLFGSGTQSARRMHQLARSIIIFDEVQTLPVRCVHMFNNTLNFLVNNCGSTVVLCTATQPLLNFVDNKFGSLNISSKNEMMPDVCRLFNDLKRVDVLDRRKTEGWSSDEVADLAVNEVQCSGSALAILNTRKAALNIFEKCSQKTQAEVYHLSTSMCPAHRMKTLDRIRVCLDSHNPIPVLCISTQLIEAGVDVDFGSVIRSVAGLDSIAQAAGRCNRNGLRPRGKVFIINPDFEKLDKLKDISIGKEKAVRLLDEYKQDPDFFDQSILGPKAIERYFKYYFYQRASEMTYPVENKNPVVGRDATLLDLLSTNSITVQDYQRINKSAPPHYFRQSFMTASKAFNAIDSPTRGIIVPFEDGVKIIAELCSAVELEKQHKLIRMAQRYSVNVFPDEWKRLGDVDAIHEVREETGIYCLDEQYYSLVSGLSQYPVNKSTFLEA